MARNPKLAIKHATCILQVSFVVSQLKPIISLFLVHPNISTAQFQFLCDFSIFFGCVTSLCDKHGNRDIVTHTYCNWAFSTVPRPSLVQISVQTVSTSLFSIVECVYYNILYSIKLFFIYFLIRFWSRSSSRSQPH